MLLNFTVGNNQKIVVASLLFFVQSVKAHLRGMSLTYCDVLKGSPLFLCIFFG